MRFATDESFLDAAGAAIPFVDLAASVTVPLSAVEGTVPVFAQFQARSTSGFVFSSDVFALDVVHDKTAPTVEEVRVPGLELRGEVVVANAAAGANPNAIVDVTDLESAVDLLAVVVTTTDEAPAAPAVSEEVEAVPGLVRINQEVPLGADQGDLFAWFFATDRAGNVSAPARVPFLRDDTVPAALPILVENANGGALHVRTAQLRFDTSSIGSDDPPALMIVGIEPLDPGADPEPFAETVTVPVPDAYGDGVDVTFVARLIDRANNESVGLATSGDIALSLRTHLGGTVTLDRASELGVTAQGTIVDVLDAAGTVHASGLADALGVFFLGRPAIVGELLVSPGSSNGFWIATLGYNTTTYAATEPRRRVQLARSSAFLAHVLGDRIYLSALGRSLEVIEIR